LIRPGLKPGIYRTEGEHTNHYTTDVVKIFENDKNRASGMFDI
jgi:hypothetical protein